MSTSMCHRCGARAPRGPSGRSICARCAVRAEPRSSAPELDELRRRAGVDDAERISLPFLPSSPDTRLVAPVLERRSRRIPLGWPALALTLALGVSMGASAAVLVHATSQPAPADTATRAGPTPEPATPRPEPSGVAVAPEEPAAEPTPEAEPEAEPVVTAPAPALRPAHRPRRPAPESEVAPEPAPNPTPRPAVAERPSRAAVRDAFLRVHDGVQACGDVELIGTTVVARVIFDAGTGRARFAQVTDAHVPPQVRSCVARVARDAQVEPFGGADLTVVYPFRL